MLQLFPSVSGCRKLLFQPNPNKCPKNVPPQVQRNPDALGNAWFVDNINIVQDADSEILALNNFDPYNTAIVDKRFLSQLYNTKSDNTDLVVNNLNYKDNANSKISLLEYQPNYLKYSINAEEDGVVIFSVTFGT